MKSKFLSKITIKKSKNSGLRGRLDNLAFLRNRQIVLNKI